MSASKSLLIKSIILSIICISIFAALLDFSRLLGPLNLYSIFPIHLIKRINVILATLLVWLAGNNSLNKQDNAMMKFVFFFICCGEVFFLLAKPTLAIGFFVACQCLLIFRHCKGLWYKLNKASQAQKLKLTLPLFILISLMLAIIMILSSMVQFSSLMLMGILYFFILSISLWTALASHILGLFTYKNTRMAAIGLICFYLCDISVGLDGLLWTGPAWLIATSLTWVFYTPAITLLALSSYKLESSPTIANI